MRDLLESIAGGATPRRSDDSLYADDGVRFFRILNVDDGEIVDQDLKYVTEAVHQGELSRSQLASGDVLMTITGRVGSAAVVGEEHLPANINQHIARLRINRERCRPEFLSEWLNCPRRIGTFQPLRFRWNPRRAGLRSNPQPPRAAPNAGDSGCPIGSDACGAGGTAGQAGGGGGALGWR